MPDGFAAEGLARGADIDPGPRTRHRHRIVGNANDKHCATRRIRASSRIKALRWNHATHNPHGFACAASGHARLGYAGGSRRSPQPVEAGDPGPAGIFDRELFAGNFGPGGNRHHRNDANHNCHVPARLLDMIGKRAVVIIYSVTMDSAIGVPMCDGMTVAAMGMVNGKADVIMAGISRGRLRRGNTDTLERKGQSGRHHHDNSKPSEKRLSREPQRSGSLDNALELYRTGVPQDKGLPAGVS